MASNAEQLIDRWINDTAFRTVIRHDPEAAAAAVGVTLSEDERAAIKAIDWSLSDEQLSERATKIMNSSIAFANIYSTGG